jgi:hypothetical protein
MAITPGQEFALPPNASPTPAQPAAGFSFGNMFSQANNWLQQNPEKFSVIADSIGRGLAPNNPMAGIGTFMAQSSLANKATKAQQVERQSMLDALRGTLNNPNVYNDQQAPNLGVPGIGDFTAAGVAGPTSMTLTGDGYSIKGNTRDVNKAAGTGASGGTGPPPPGVPQFPQSVEGVPEGYQGGVNPPTAQRSLGNYFNPPRPW